MTSHELPGDVRTVLTYRGTVYPWQCDHMGHMNVMSYIGKFDEASWQLLSGLGLTASRFRKERLGMAAVEQRIVYKRELFAGDAVTIHSSLLEVNEKSMRIAPQDDERRDGRGRGRHRDRRGPPRRGDQKSASASVRRTGPRGAWWCAGLRGGRRRRSGSPLELAGAGADRSFSFGPLV